MTAHASFTARARTDARDWLIEADEPLAGLQLRSGGELPGIIASPALLELVRKARVHGLRLARPIRAQDDFEQVSAWVEVVPEGQGEGCMIEVSDWRASPLREDDSEAAVWRMAIARQLSELTARLGPQQELIAVDTATAELEPVAQRMRHAIGRPWTEFVAFEGNVHQQPLHWRLLDGARLRLEGSTRRWKAHLIPLGPSSDASGGFELYLVADEPADELDGASDHRPGSPGSAGLGRDIAPILRQAITRIVANAETIHTQLAGPLSEEYSKYAADIAIAGEHLLALIDDLAELDAVEDERFTTAPERIDLAELARRAAGILRGRAHERGVRIDAPKVDEAVPAIGESRRVLQILLNLLGNAIRYSPEQSQVWLRAELDGATARIVIADQGPGLSEEQQARMFDKFERLGRRGDGGSGLGLYISRRLATAMGGELTVESAPGQGSRFVLELPGAGVA